VAERFLSTLPNRGAPIVPQLSSGTSPGNQFSKTLNVKAQWWAHKGSNLGPLPCEGNALPLSYAPGRPVRRQKGAIYEAGGGGVKLNTRAAVLL
jgi:hypothetical protein